MRNNINTIRNCFISILLLLLVCICSGNASNVVTFLSHSVPGCNPATEYIGHTGNGSTGAASTVADVIACNLFTPTCSGNLNTFYIQHYLGNDQLVKGAVYLDDGDETPGTGDTKIEATAGSAHSTTTEWVNTAFGGSTPVSTANKYWLCMITGGGTANGWSRYYSNGATAYYKTVAGSYAAPPATLQASFTSAANAKYSMYTTLGN